MTVKLRVVHVNFAWYHSLNPEMVEESLKYRMGLVEKQYDIVKFNRGGIDGE